MWVFKKRCNDESAKKKALRKKESSRPVGSRYKGEVPNNRHFEHFTHHSSKKKFVIAYTKGYLSNILIRFVMYVLNINSYPGFLITSNCRSIFLM